MLIRLHKALKSRFKPIYFFFGLLGPGLITTAAGNDAGGIATYSVAGAKFGFSLLWIMLPLTLGFILVQEMSARLGAASGKGFSDLVRENYSLRTTVFLMLLLTISNVGIIVSEYAGIAASLELFGLSKYLTVPISAFLVWFLMVKGSYDKVEKVFLAMSGVLLSYVLAAFLTKPDWLAIFRQVIQPQISTNPEYLKFTVALIGTTIAPFMQVFAQSSVVEKGITMSDYKYEVIDTLVGTIFANLVAVFIIITTAQTLFKAGTSIETAAQAALALKPLAGQGATILFAVGLLGASLLAAGVVPITTSFALANAFGWESGISKKAEQAPIFYAVFTILVVFSATVTLSPAISLINLLLRLQVMNGLLLPIQLVFMIKLANNQNIMGKYKNSRVFNLFIWATAIIIGLTSILYLLTLLINIF